MPPSCSYGNGHVKATTPTVKCKPGGERRRTLPGAHLPTVGVCRTDKIAATSENHAVGLSVTRCSVTSENPNFICDQEGNLLGFEAGVVRLGRISRRYLGSCRHFAPHLYPTVALF